MIGLSIIYSNNMPCLRLMLERCRHIHIALNIKNYLFVTLIGILLGHVVCNERIKVNLAKIKVILDLNPPINPKQVRAFLCHTRY